VAFHAPHRPEQALESSRIGEVVRGIEPDRDHVRSIAARRSVFKPGSLRADNQVANFC
jgi:hypothetical protein